MKQNWNGKLANLIGLTSVFLFFLGFTPMAHAGDAFLSWDSNTEPDLAGYKVYYRLGSNGYGPPIDVGTQTSYTVTGLGTGIYYFSVSAYDALGNESPKSTEVSKSFFEGSGGGGSQISTNSGPAAGGCGFLKNINETNRKPLDFAMFLVPLALMFRSLFNSFFKRENLYCKEIAFFNS